MNFQLICAIISSLSIASSIAQVVKDSDKVDEKKESVDQELGINMKDYQFRNERVWYMYCHKREITEEMLQQFISCFGDASLVSYRRRFTNTIIN